LSDGSSESVFGASAANLVADGGGNDATDPLGVDCETDGVVEKASPDDERSRTTARIRMNNGGESLC